MIAALPAEQRPLVIGFAAETQEIERYARDKLQRKGLDMIVANDISQVGLGFGSDQNAAWLLWRTKEGVESRTEAPQPKTQLAASIIRQALALLSEAAAEKATKPVSKQLPKQAPGESL
jgi:phosphopantothenoylcysteine decarboxylase / phosphopantothenate---cysteine ligase